VLAVLELSEKVDLSWITSDCRNQDRNRYKQSGKRHDQSRFMKLSRLACGCAAYHKLHSVRVSSSSIVGL
jgi:hypothetical protein